MSFFGPRPALEDQMDLVVGRTLSGISDFTAGITGWFKVNGRNSISVENKITFKKISI